MIEPRSRVALVLAATALVVAAGIYATARDGLVLHEWIRIAWPGWRGGAELPEFVRFNLPDALWQYAFCVCVLLPWRSARPTAHARAFVLLPILIGLGSELGQAAHVIEGVFDPLDVATMSLAVLAAMCTVGLPGSGARSFIPDQIEARG